MLKDLARSVSFANLCFMASWPELLALSLNPAAQYERYKFNGYVAIILNVAVLAAFGFVAVTLTRRFAGAKGLKIAGWLFLLAMILPIHAIIQTQVPSLEINSGSPVFGSLKGTILGGLCVAAAVVTATRFQSGAVKIVSTLLLLLFPFALWTFGRTAYIMQRFRASDSAPMLASNRSSPRVLWFVFDELDQRIAFSERPPGLKLPELDRLRGESLFAANAFPPAESTLLSLPALISGRLVSSAYVASPSSLMVTFGESAEFLEWAEQPNVFLEARELGINSTLAGWYHPYTRLIGDSLTRCVFEDRPERPVVQHVRKQLRAAILSLPFARSVPALRDMAFGEFDDAQDYRKQSRIDMYQRTLGEAMSSATDPNIGISFIHWPVPHLPVIYDRETDEFKWSNRSNYLDNLALVDRTVGEIRRALEGKGLWDDTVVVITSDHPARKSKWGEKFDTLDEQQAAIVGRKTDPRVPFLLKLRGQKEGLVYQPEFNTVLTAGIVLGILRGEISSVESLNTWLEQHRTIGESPYKKSRLKQHQGEQDDWTRDDSS
jgi:hypothetical protein